MNDTRNPSKKTTSDADRVRVPDRFYEPARQQGHLERMIYQSREYTGDGSSVEKAAMIYLPYGYEASEAQEKRYNILYLMHGSGGTEIEYMGSEKEPNRLKNMVDHMIEEKMMDPDDFRHADLSDGKSGGMPKPGAELSEGAGK